MASKQSNDQRPATLRHPLSSEAVELIAVRLRVIAEPTRIRLLEHLNHGNGTVQDLASNLGTTRQNVSKHLGVLYRAGMLSRRRSGTSVYYSLEDWTGWWLVQQIASSVSSHLDDLRSAFPSTDGE